MEWLFRLIPTLTPEALLRLRHLAQIRRRIDLDRASLFQPAYLLIAQWTHPTLGATLYSP